ncbi:MAG: response regulator [Novosphingobium sp.]|nr:response regulator [Novosphingobium sp.]MBO9601542.1 response regulator [Novosphingobium sp.]
MSTALLIEDEFLIRELAEAYLSDAGFEVTTTRDGREALDVLDGGTQFDLLFTDIRMPGGIDGREVAEEAKKRIPGLRIVYATGYSDAADELSAREACIEKPYTMSTLRRVLGDLGFAEEASS